MITAIHRIEALRDSFKARRKNLSDRNDKKLNDHVWASAYDVFVLELDSLLSRIDGDETTNLVEEMDEIEKAGMR